MRYEAILFDMDGVVVNTRLAVTTFWRQVAADHGRSLTLKDLDQWVYGCPANETLDALFPHLSESRKKTIFQALQAAEQQAVYQEVSGVVALLRTLHLSQIPTALVTGAQRWKVEAVLSQLGLSGLFAVQVSAEDIERGKPDPEGYLRAAHLLKCPVSSCIVFEDAPGGVQAACSAGALCIGVCEDMHTSPLLEAGARYVIPDFTTVTVQRSPSNIEQGDREMTLCVETALPLVLVRQKVEPKHTAS